MKDFLRKHTLSNFLGLAWGFVGLAILAVLSIVYFPFIDDNGVIYRSAYPLLGGSALGYAVIMAILAQLRAHPSSTSPIVVNFVATLCGLILFMALAAERVYFSLKFLALYILFTNIWFSIEFAVRSRVVAYTFGVVPGGYDILDGEYQNIRLVQLDDPGALPEGIDGVVADFERELPERWVAFVSRCLMEGVPVVSTDDFIEAEHGLIILEHLTTARILVFQRIEVYLAIKQAIETLLVLVTAPIWILICAAAAVAISLESPGPVLFRQVRIGMKGKPYKIFKLRSMRTDSEQAGPAFAAKGDSRVTKVGAFIRKYRIDEYPQFINILRGEMSLIGPRPEQAAFVERFEKTIPYYQLRHIVRPGITGWAQVTKGYAADEAQTAIKLAADLYYVKRVSPILDFLIAIKTIKTMFTGFGAR
jgi:UDP-GalNAc:undecaprenyl-phosphate GalNAc-1-phosphate transferase